MTGDSDSTNFPTRPDAGNQSRRTNIDGASAFDTGRDGTRPETADEWWFAVGDVIAGRYTVRRRLGRGGMGEVYEVDDEQAREIRALKVMRAELVNSSVARDRFRNESRSRRLNHENIVSTIDIGESPEQNLLYISMEQVDAVSLREYMQRNKLTPVQALQVAGLVCRALEYAHRNQVIHRDIKPDNVLIRIDSSGLRVWLTDFGIAQLQSDGLTRTGSVFGTVAYAAPEQKHGADAVTHSADLYSVGVMLYEMLTGILPEGYFDLPSSLVRGIPAGVDDLIRDSLASRPENRISDAGLFAARLATCLKASGNSVPAPRQSAGHVADVVLAEIRFTDFEAKKAPQVIVDGVPGLPDEILSLEGEVESLQQTLAMIEARTHPRIVEQETQLAQLADRVAGLREAADKIRPPELTGNQYVDLERRIRKDEIGPSQLRTAFSHVKMAPLFAYVEQLAHWINANDRFSEQKSKLKKNIVDEKQRLVDLLKKKRELLVSARDKDLRKLTADYFRTFRRQNPSADPQRFPLAAWARFQQDVLVKRRYGLSEIEISEVAEDVWNPKQARQKAAVRKGLQPHSNTGWGGTLLAFMVVHFFVWSLSPTVIAIVSPKVDLSPDSEEVETMAKGEEAWVGEADDDHDFAADAQSPTASLSGEAEEDNDSIESGSVRVETSPFYAGLEWAYSFLPGGLFLLWYSYRRSVLRLLGLIGLTMFGGVIMFDIVWPYFHAPEQHYGWIKVFESLEYDSGRWRLFNFAFIPVLVGTAMLWSTRAAVGAAVLGILTGPYFLELEAQGPIGPSLFVRQQFFSSMLTVAATALLLVLRMRLTLSAAFIFWCRLRKSEEPRALPRPVRDGVDELHRRLPWSK